jgi:hypothetical protein
MSKRRGARRIAASLQSPICNHQSSIINKVPLKSELIHLLSKLKAEHPDAQNIIIPMSGSSVTVTLQHGVRRFETLDSIEAYAWPQPAVTESAS